MTARRAAWIAAAALLAGWPAWTFADEEGGRHRRAVKAVADQRLTVTTAAGAGSLPLYLSADWTQPLPDVTRAVVVFHGRLRNADDYYRSAESTLAAAGEAGRGTLLIVPQFLTPADIEAHALPDSTLRWSATGWMGGEPAAGPAKLSSYDAVDAIVARLADRSLFPRLTQVVAAGHSGGGQVVQRYAVVGQAAAALRQGDVKVRYVIANPSSYVYFNAERPRSTANCAGFNRWKYGMEERLAYAAKKNPQELERDYARRDVIYLLGAKDVDPHHRALDKSCEAEAQGPHRLARGHAYFDYIRRRNPGEFSHRLHDVAGVGHSGSRMLTSACGLAALFGNGSCGSD